MVVEPTSDGSVPTSDGSVVLPNAVWWLIGAAVGFTLVFWAGFVVMAQVADDESTSAVGTAASEPAASEPAAAGATGSVAVAATEFAFEHPQSQPAGVVELSLVNEGVVFHDLQVLGPDGVAVSGFLLETEPGETASGEIELSAGTYTLVCTVPGHREAGMESTLTIDG